MPDRIIDMEVPDIPLMHRLMKNIHIDSTTGCWNWTASTVNGGYGQVKVRPKDGLGLLRQSESGKISFWLIEYSMKSCADPSLTISFATTCARSARAAIRPTWN
jgi:hypothetical protein